jgi:hypothetical protein
MKKNVGSTDKIIRLVLAVVIFAIGIYYQSWWGLVGIIPLFTALINWCPVYLPFGIFTNKVKLPVQK